MKKMLVKVMESKVATAIFEPFSTITQNPRTPGFVLTFIFNAGKRNPFNSAFVPSTWKYILANPNFKVNDYVLTMTRESLVSALLKNPNISADTLETIWHTNEFSHDTMYGISTLARKIAKHPNVDTVFAAKLESDFQLNIK